MKRTLIHSVTIVNEGQPTQGSVAAENGHIAEVLANWKPLSASCEEVVDATGCYLLPGIIDDYVYFRDPGLTHKADILTESSVATVGGVTFAMDIPNTNPLTVTLDVLNSKFDLLNEKCVINRSCYFGATNDSYAEFDKLGKSRVYGIRLLMSSSIGNILVDKINSLLRIFNDTDMLIATYYEGQEIIKANIKMYKKRCKGTNNVPVNVHPGIRSTSTCYASSELAIHLVRIARARLRILHVFASRELKLFSNEPSKDKNITSGAYVTHLLHILSHYNSLGARIKCNPAAKKKTDREALRAAVNSGLTDVIATGHAPHLLSEKEGGAPKAMSNMPMIRFSLINMLGSVDEGIFSLETLVQKMCHAPAQIYGICRRGYIREGYQAGLVLVRPNSPWEVISSKILSRRGQNPLEGYTFSWEVEKAFANEHLIYNGDTMDGIYRGEELRSDYRSSKT